MTKEQEEAIERLQNRIKETEDYKTTQVFLTTDTRAIKTVLSMLEEKDKIIDLMSEMLTTPIHNKEWIKQYYENKAKENQRNMEVKKDENVL